MNKHEIIRGEIDVHIEPYDDYCPNCGAKMDGERDDAR